MERTPQSQPQTDPILYTLADARKKLNEIDCRRLGHRFQIQIDHVFGDPKEIVCTRCSITWEVK